MLQIILILLGIILFVGLIKNIFPYLLGLTIIGGIAWVTYEYWKIAIPVCIVLVTIGIYFGIQERKKIIQWKSEPSKRMTIHSIYTLLNSFLDENIEDNNPREDYIFHALTENKIPYGRANAFLNIFDTSIKTEEVIYYSAIRSKDNHEIREYGTLITDKGIYISKQLDTKDNNGNYNITNISTKFSGIINCEVDNKNIKLTIVDSIKDITNTLNIESNLSSIKPTSISIIINKIINSGISRSLYHNNVTHNEINTTVTTGKEYDSSHNIETTAHIADLAAIAGSNIEFNHSYAETKGFMNGARGHGYAAEYGNNTFDRLMGRNVVNTGQQLDENGRQMKHGADRTVDGINIQTKYYKTANESIGAAFVHKEAIYLNQDGKMMAIEVPRDQYNDAIKLMQKRIDNGQVPNISPGENAENYVKKGFFTYNQACNICKAGTIEGISVDFTNGVICSLKSSSISGIIIFASCIWNGKTIKEATELSISSTFKILGKNAFIYTMTMQLSRDQFANYFAPRLQNGLNGTLAKAGYEGISNPIAKLSNNIAKSINDSAIAKTSIGESMGLKTLSGRAIISAGVMGAVIFGPDLVRAMRGRISKAQLLKNSAVGATSLGGAAIGQAIIPIPIVGAMIGASISAYIAKKTLDNFIEDDSIEMFQILKEEFIECSMSFDISQDEFDKLLDSTICNKNIGKLLQDMYQSGIPRHYASEIMNSSLIHLLTDRTIITESMMITGQDEFIQSYIAA